MAAENMDMSLVEQTCDAFMSINEDYYSNLYRQDPRKPGDWWTATGPAIINMYSAYLLNPSLMMKCAQEPKYRQTQNSINASLINLIYRFDIGDTETRDAPRNLMSKSPEGRNLIDILEQQKVGIMGLMRGHRDDDPVPMDIDNLGGGRKRKQKGGALSDSSKRALANIIVAGAIVGTGITMFNMGGMKLLTSRLVNFLSPAFQDNTHCLTVFGYFKNRAASTAGLAKSCSVIATENASAADWVVTKVQLAMAAIGLAAGTGMYARWTMMQNFVIRFVIDPIDNGVDYFRTPRGAQMATIADGQESIIAKVISAEVGISAMKAYSIASPETRTLLLQEAGKTGDARVPLFFNKDIQAAITANNVSSLGPDLDVVLPGQTPPADATQLNDVYREVYFNSIQSAASDAAQELVAQAQTALLQATQNAAALVSSTGGKKKRKTIKKKKKHHKKHARKTGKKKMHKKKGKKTAKKHHKKHHKKHNKKHHKKNGRKTRKH